MAKEYIEREAVVKELQEELDCESLWYTKEQNKHIDIGLRIALRAIEKHTAADVVEVKHGQWVLGTSNHHEWMKCSECLHSYDVTGVFVYCPNCVTVQKWIPVTERLPENEVDVLICARRESYKGGFYTHVATAFHTDGKMNTEDSQYNWDIDNADMEYDEEAGAYIVPEGWWEAVRYGEEFSAVDDFVTHWMPLPEPPKDGGAENGE